MSFIFLQYSNFVFNNSVNSNFRIILIIFQLTKFDFLRVKFFDRNVLLFGATSTLSIYA
jgi:hypothetical protein